MKHKTNITAEYNSTAIAPNSSHNYQTHCSCGWKSKLKLNYSKAYWCGEQHKEMES